VYCRKSRARLRGNVATTADYTDFTDHVTRKEGREEPIRLQQANEESQPPMDTNEHEFINQLSIDSPATPKLAKTGVDWWLTVTNRFAGTNERPPYPSVLSVQSAAKLFLLFLAEFLESGIAAQRVPNRIEPKEHRRNGRWPVTIAPTGHL
jgi:hypothetical protein